MPAGRELKDDAAATRVAQALSALNMDDVAAAGTIKFEGPGVMTGEWRDYAFSFGPSKASFFIFRHSFETPLFVISKLEARARQGRYLVSSRGQKLSQSATLEDVLEIFARPIKLVSG